MATHIPIELICNILASLPVMLLLRFKCVCKDWYILISSSYFIQLHLNKSLETDSFRDRPLAFTRSDSLLFVDDLDSPTQVNSLSWPPPDAVQTYKTLHIVGSCNGLVCLTVNRLNADYGFIICNPLTRAFKHIAHSSILPCLYFEILLSYGFGYDSHNDDYKIFIISKRMGIKHFDMFHYSVKTDEWRKANTTTQPLLTRRSILRNAIFLNNMLHFPVEEFKGYNMRSWGVDNTIDDDDAPDRIARLDLCSLEWQDELGLSFLLSDKMCKLWTLFDGCLCITVRGRDCKSYDIWIMKEYGVEESWIKLFSVDQYDHKWRRPLAYSKTAGLRRILIETDKYGFESFDVFWYDLQTEEVEKFGIESSLRDSTSVELFVGSLVSIPGSTLWTKREAPPTTATRPSWKLRLKNLLRMMVVCN